MSYAMPHANQVVRAIRRVLLAGAVLALAGCGEVTGPRGDLADARARWQRTRPERYQFALSLGCFCGLPPQPVTIVVQGDSIVSAVDATGAPVQAPIRGAYITIDGVFREIASALVGHAAEVRATYDPQRGHPVDVWIDRSRNVADEEIGYTISAFQAR